MENCWYFKHFKGSRCFSIMGWKSTFICWYFDKSWTIEKI